MVGSLTRGLLTRGATPTLAVLGMGFIAASAWLSRSAAPVTRLEPALLFLTLTIAMAIAFAITRIAATDAARANAQGEWTAAALLAARAGVSWLSPTRWFCLVAGHDDQFRREPRRLFLQCAACRRCTRGWTISEHPPRITAGRLSPRLGPSPTLVSLHAH